MSYKINYVIEYDNMAYSFNVEEKEAVRHIVGLVDFIDGVHIESVTEVVTKSVDVSGDFL